jgi:SAM-dependent methyltransferase
MLKTGRNMGNYTGIAPYYDRIFPFDETQIVFLRERLFRYNSRQACLDVGCGTGTILYALSDIFDRLVGIDLDSALLKQATGKTGNSSGKVLEFYEADMMNLEALFARGSFDCVLCLGNTLPHLSRYDFVQDFFRIIYGLLSENGLFIFQTVNYDRVLDSHVLSLPVIETSDFVFRRTYSALKANGKIDFNIVLHNTAKDDDVDSSVELLPIRMVKYCDCVESSGFAKSEFFGSYDGSVWNEDSVLTIGVCQK